MSEERIQSGDRDSSGGFTPPARPRPLLGAALAMMAGVAISEHCGVVSASMRGGAVFLFTAAVAAIFWNAGRGRVGKPALVVLVTLAGFAFGFARHQAAVDLPANHIAHMLGEEPVLTQLAGRVVTQPTTTPAEKRNPHLPFDPPPRTRFALDVAELRTVDPPAAVCGYVRVSVEAESLDVRPGDRVVVTGNIYRPHGPSNPGENDWARWSRLQNIHAGLSVEGPVHVRKFDDNAARPLGWLAHFRGCCQSTLFEPFSEPDADQSRRLLDAMVLGHRSAAGRTLNDAFLRTGSIHYLTVSGLHVGVIAGVAWWVTRRWLRRGVRTTALVVMGVILLYVAVVEQNAPILRAATMGVLLCLARLTRRPFCSLNWLAPSAMVILAINPLELFRAGFQLSFVQVFALLTVVLHIHSLVVRQRTDNDEVPADADSWPRFAGRWLWRKTVALAIICVCAWVIALPLVLYHFGRFAPWGALQAIVVAPFAIVTIVLGFLALITGWIPGLGVVMGELLRLMTEALLAIVELLAQIPGTLIEVAPPPAWVVFVTYGLALLLLRETLWRKRTPPTPHESPIDAEIAAAARRRRRARALVALAAIPCTWAACVLSPAEHAAGELAVHVLSVGSGSAALVVTPTGEALLCDAGTIHNFDAGETTVRAARSLGVRRLAVFAISHANFDHYGGTPTVLEELPTRRLCVNAYCRAALADNPQAEQTGVCSALATRGEVLSAGDAFKLGGARVEVLWPPSDLDENEWGANDRSLVLKVSANDRSVLLPGDIERPAIRALLARHDAGEIDLLSDVLIAPHHGAVLPHDTARFYETVAPLAVINSTARERKKLTTMIAEQFGDEVELLSTHNAGAVTVRFKSDGTMKTETPFAESGESGE